jgi:N-acetylneuraminic acid mutarotase
MIRNLLVFLPVRRGAFPGSSLIAVMLILFPPAGRAQTTGWAWMTGSSKFTANVNGEQGSPGVYGTLGQAAAANVPGGRLGAVSWTDAAGKFWLFGGGGMDSVPQFGFLNDLWKYDPATGQWTWMSGSKQIPAFNGGQPGNYGTLGTPAATNVPGGRSGALGWVDTSGNLWLFGGAGFDSTGAGQVNLNDLWKYDPATRLWTWMGGASTVGVSGGTAGTYGTPGSLTAGSYPGSRNNAVTWVDGGGHFWMFGGYGEDANNQHGWLNDFWKFVPSTSQWAWMGGASAVGPAGGVVGIYGTLGTPDPANMPGGRDGSAGWVDKGGNLWMFGGYGFAPSGSTVTNGPLNDLWEFSPATNEWAWMGGSNLLPSTCVAQPNTCGHPGVYGIKADFAAANTPGSRSSSTAWAGEDGNVWLFGGMGYDSAGVVGPLNDLWIFDLSTKQWAWMSGSSTVGSNGQPGVYGTQGTPGAGNSPGGRDSATGWVDGKGNLWMMSGNGLDANGTFGYLNDLWEFPLTASAPVFSLSAGTYTSVQTVKLTDSTPGAAIYYTTDGTTPTAASTAYSGPITVNSTETIRAVALATGYSASSIASAAFTINLPPASAPAFSVPGGTYTSIQTVSISDSTPGAAIYYTTDGTTPTTASTAYSGPITVNATETIQATAVAPGYSASPLASAAYIINLPPPDFTLAVSSTSLTVNAGGQATVTLTVTPQNGFNSAVSFACSGLQAGASCSFNPTSVTPNQATNVVLTITAGATASVRPNGLFRRPFVPLWAFACCLFLAAKRRNLFRSLALLALGATLSLFSACGGSNSSPMPGPTPITSTIGVTATSGSIQQKVTVTLTVK